jgi:hypothetical protein
MESIKFLTERLKELHTSLPYLQIKYEFRHNINTHIIEVKPAQFYEEDNKYIERQIELEDTFESLFPEDEILFMTENVLVQIGTPVLELDSCTVSEEIPVVGAEIINVFAKDVSEFYNEFFYFISEVNENIQPYIQCSPTSILIEPEDYRVGLKDGIERVRSGPIEDFIHHFSSKKTKQEKAKKDSEFIQSLFFLVLLQHDKIRTWHRL